MRPPAPSAAVPAAASGCSAGAREWLLMGALLLLAFWPFLRWMYERWTAADSYTSHGLLVPLISAYFVARQRPQWAQLPRRPAWLGLWLVAGALLLLIAGGILRVYFTSGLALLLCLVGMLAYWGGWHWVRQLWFPLLFLVFMLPLPEIAIARANLWLKLEVASLAVFGADLAGIAVAMDGAKLHLGNGELVVGDVCSGLRSLLALLALGVLHAYVYGRDSRLIAGTLLLAVVPAALAANVVRIFLNIVFVECWGTDLLFKPLAVLPLAGECNLHLLSGLLVFVIALLILHLTLLGSESLVRWRGGAA